MQHKRLLYVLIMSALLSACGGGGSGNSSPPAPIADFDNDGIADSVDTDDDNDGVPDINDAFPFDASEYVDTDGDGIGNNADEDDDNDGVTDSEDAFPLDPNESVDSDSDGTGDNADFYAQDARCFNEQDGNGEQCYLTYFKQNIRNIHAYSFNEKIAFLDDSTNQIIQLSSNTGSFESPIQVDLDERITTLVYAPTEAKFYAGSDQGAIYKVDMDGAIETFYQSNNLINEIYLMGAFVGVFTNSANLEIFDKNGVSLADEYLYGRHFAMQWDEASYTAYLYETDNSYDHHIFTVTLNPDNGQIESLNQIFPVPSSQASRDLLLPPQQSDYFIYAGKIYQKVTLNEMDSVDMASSSHSWDSETGLVTLNYVAGDTTLSWFNNQLHEYTSQTIDGSPLAIARNQSRAIVITERLAYLQLNIFEFSNDVDGDLVINEVDAFPSDPAASTDTDNDLYPDSWNQGMSAADSTTGLTLDAFPQEYDCWLTDHALADGTCDYAATVPALMPTSTMAGPDNTAFIYQAETGRVYVYHADSATFSASMDFSANVLLGQMQSPQHIEYSIAHERFYFHFGNNTLFAADYSEGQVAEMYEVATFEGEEVLQLSVSVGDFLLAKMQGSFGTRYLLDKNGVVTDSATGYYFSNTLAWNAVNNRLYHFRDGISPNDIMFTEISQTTGLFSEATESPYHGDFVHYGPIRVVNNGREVVTGAGNIFDAETLVWQGSYGPLHNIVGLDNNETLIVNRTGSATQLVRKDSSNRVLESIQLNTANVHVISTANEHVLVYPLNGELIVENFIANNDSDGDGTDNTVDAFPTDASASVDTDNDGYPDEWNSGYSAADSTLGLALDPFPIDSACWLDSHAAEDGSCDYAATMPEFTPADTLIDDNGIVYLLNGNNATIYRWSSTTEAYINPIRLGQSNGFVQSTLIALAFSGSQQRLYLGYSDGEITFVDVQGELTEQPFYRLSQQVDGLVAVGEFVLAQDSSGSWESHYVIDQNGNLTDSQDWNYYSTYYAWNPANQRVYFFRSTTSPNDLHYEVIDQNSGLITDSGETPYHGDYIIEGPILVTASGQRVLLGSGDYYDADDLTWLGNIGRFDDAVTLSNGQLLLLRQTAGDFNVVRMDDTNRVLEEYSLDVEQASLISNGTNHLLFTIDEGAFGLIPVVANDDTDGDGVVNTADDFPMDIAASVDTDADGYPDNWNSGFTEADSTTGLMLDAFPNESACWLAEHAASNGACDYAATLPSFTPSETVIDELGVVYLLNPQDSKVYRWSSETEAYLNPLQAGQLNGFSLESPAHMAYSAAHRRLYFGYDDGEITYINLDGDLSQQSYFRLPLAVGGLVATGNFMLAQDASGAWNTHYIINENGTLADSEDWNRYSREYAWNEANNRVYFFRDQTSPNDLHFEDINPASGEITADGETPYHDGSNIRLPLRVINNGEHVILGSGVIYNAGDLTIATNLGVEVTDVVGFDEVFMAIVEDNGSLTLNMYGNDSHRLLGTQPLDAGVYAIFPWGQRLVMVGRASGEFTFSVFNTGDNDGDGIPAWWEVTYNLSDEDASDALWDNDADGLTSLEEYTLGTNPELGDSDSDGLLDGTEVNTYQTGPLTVDTDSDGLSDSDEVLTHGTSPVEVDSDSDSFSDGDEVLLYATDPLDENSVPDAITSYSESFEANTIPAMFATTSESDASWQISTFEPQEGSQSVRSGTITDNETSSMTLTGLFATGTLAFDVKVSAEACCDILEVYVNDALTLTISNGEWSTEYIDLNQGVNTIEWRYYKDGSVSDGEDAAFIDNIVFSQ